MCKYVGGSVCKELHQKWRQIFLFILTVTKSTTHVLFYLPYYGRANWKNTDEEIWVKCLEGNI